MEHQIPSPGTTTHPKTKTRVGQKLIKLLIGFIAVPTAVATLAGLAGGWWWGLDLFSHFRWYYMWALAAAVVVSVLVGGRRLAAVWAVPLMINLYLVAPLYLSSSSVEPDRPQAANDVVLKLLHINVLVNNPNHRAVLDAIHRSGADVVFLQEINGRWLAALREGIRPASDVDELSGGETSSGGGRVRRYRLALAQSREDAFGVAVLVADPLDLDKRVIQTRTVDLTHGQAGVPAVEMTLQWNGREVSLLSLHTLPPVRSWYARVRDLQLEAAGRWVASQRGAAIVIGDLNTTPWSAAYRALMAQTGLIDSQAGFGYQPTFPSRGVIGIPIDHCLHTRDLVTLDRRVGAVGLTGQTGLAHDQTQAGLISRSTHGSEGVGSDHLPLAVTLGWAKKKP